MPSPLGDKIRAARKQKGFSLDALAKKVESSKSYIWELENRDDVNPGVELLTRIAVELEVTTEHLLSRSSELPEEEVVDQAFFRKYQQLPTEAKKQLRKIIYTWD